MSFRRFAFLNVKRNAGAYAAFFLSSGFAVTIFFMYAMFMFHPDFDKELLGASVRMGMQAAEAVVFLFSFLFVLYSTSAFLKARSKELGLLTLLGATGSQLNRLIWLENMAIGAASIVSGIAAGVVLSKLFLLYGAKVIEMKPLPFYWSWQAALLTVAAFAALFMLVSLFTAAFIRRSRSLELLQGAHKPKPEPRVSIWLGSLSALCFAAAFYLLGTNELEQLPVVLLLIGFMLIGTYLFYTQLSVLLIRLLKRNRPLFWRGVNLLWISEMAYKIKDNARMFFMVTAVMAMACVAAGIVITQEEVGKKEYRQNPFAFRYDAFPGDGWKGDIAAFEQGLAERGVAFASVAVPYVHPVVREYDAIADFELATVIGKSAFDRLAPYLLAEPSGPLRDAEAIRLVSKRSTNDKDAARRQIDRLTVGEGQETIRVVRQWEPEALPYVAESDVLVVSDAVFERLKRSERESRRGQETVFYSVPGWGKGMPRMDDDETRISARWQDKLGPRLEIGVQPRGFLHARAASYAEMTRPTNVLTFIGMFVAAIFSLSSVSFLYFKLYAGLNQDRRLYNGLSRIGLSLREMRRSATIQLGVLFFLPVLVAALLAMAALYVLQSQHAIAYAFAPSIRGIGLFALAQLAYFLAVRSRYLRHLGRAMV
ncbi:MAG: FtsX-like permease family protein [Paenibacillaceae bacterium]|nr:FtsX-like permease family protein [Paenibacillaceae bacterium]